MQNMSSLLRNIVLSGLAAQFVTAPLMAETPGLKKDDVVAICGDSITERAGYREFLAQYLLMCQPTSDLEAVTFGWSGERAPGFLDRMKNDVLPLKPTVATTCYGMNDGNYAATTPAVLDTYRKSMKDIVTTFKQAGLRLIVVGSPGVVDPHSFKRLDPAVYNKTLSDLTQAAKEVATEEGVVFADVHHAMMSAMEKAKAKYGAEHVVAGNDGFHPGQNGNLVMAYAFLKALGCSGDIGTITYDAKAGKASSDDAQKVLSSENGVIALESTKYPFCFYGNPSDPNATAGIIEFFPFNQDLNRYQLVVKNLDAPKAKITWGSSSKEFTKEQLESGINLAAEFLNNPFSEPFQQVAGRISRQQEFETYAIKGFITGFRRWLKDFPDETEAADRLRATLMKNRETLVADARKDIKPVKHQIKIEPVTQS